MTIRRWALGLSIIVVVLIVLIWYYGLLGLIITLPWGILLVVLANLDKVADAVASSYKLFRRVSFWFEKRAVEKRLEVTISNSAERLNSEAEAVLLPHKLDIRWVEPQSREAFLRRGEIVVCLESSYNEDRNLARAAMLYVQEDLIFESQRFVNSTVMKSLSIAITRKLLMLDRKLGALKCLKEEFIDPEIQRTPQITDYVTGMDNMDKNGLLTRVLLRNLSELDAMLSPALTHPQARRETKGFARFLKNFVERDGEDVPLEFVGTTFRIGLLPVARIDRFEMLNFLKAPTRYYEEGIDKVYLLARGINAALADLVAKEIETSKQFLKQQDWSFTMRGRRGNVKCKVIEMLRI